MSSEIKIIQDKDTGNYKDEYKQDRGIYTQDERFFDGALLSIFNNSDLYKKWNDSKTNQERKRVLWKAIEMELDYLKSNLAYDLEENVKIYPLIKKGGLKVVN